MPESGLVEGQATVVCFPSLSLCVFSPAPSHPTVQTTIQAPVTPSIVFRFRVFLFVFAVFLIASSSSRRHPARPVHRPFSSI